MTVYSELMSAIDHPNAKRFLLLIRQCEGTAGPNGYRTLFGGDLFDSFVMHPNRAITKKLGGKPITSTAAGAYQFLHRTWVAVANALGLADFSPASQDLGALYLIRGRGALVDVLSGRWESALEKCNKEWASLPGSPYGQPTKSLAFCLAFLNQGGDAAATASSTFRQSTEGEQPMAPFLAAAIPALIEAAPALIRLFGNSDQAEKNAQAAEKVADIAKAVTGESTMDGAVVAIQSSPEKSAEFREAVQSNWFDLVGEAGGGGIEGARAANKAVTPEGKPWLSPALIVSAALLPLAYMVVWAVLFRAGWSQEIQSMVVGSVISLVLGSVAGFWLGTSYSSQRKTDLLAK